MWTTTDDPIVFKPILKKFQAIRPYISITIEKVVSDDYASLLKDAWARGKGPDIFELPASWTGQFANDFIVPVPKTTNVFTYTTKKVLFKTDVTIKKTPVPSVTIPQLQNDFAYVVSEDVVRNGNIYGLPLSLDTLVLYYNKDILRSANIAEPPRTWTQLAAMAPRLSIADEDGKILQSAIAIGRGGNVLHSADIISLLLLQDGVNMNENGKVLMDVSESDEGTNLGVNALTFYASFASPSKAVYSWNAEQPKSLDAFMRGKTAMYIGYNAERDTIQNQSSINLGIAPMLHLLDDGKDAMYTAAGNPMQVNYGDYQVYSVFQRSAHPQEAWNFVQYMTKQADIASLYLVPTRKIGALNSILAKQSSDPEIGTQAQQAISARSWYHGTNATGAMQNLSAMLDSVADGKASPLEALTLARKQIELSTITKR
jgi:ABC-type glycerol-3-phosphate transport system substrate-binding protein